MIISEGHNFIRGFFFSTIRNKQLLNVTLSLVNVILIFEGETITNFDFKTIICIKKNLNPYNLKRCDFI